MFEEEYNKVEFIDLAAECDQVAVELTSLLQAGKIDDARYCATKFCQKCKSCYDSASMLRALTLVADFYVARKEFSAMLLWLQLLFQLPDQLTQVNAGIVSYCIAQSREAPRDARLSMLQWVLVQTEGKLYLDSERARVAVDIASLYEAESDFASAIKVLESVQFETNMQFELKDRLQYLLTQMKVMIKGKYFAKLGVISNKFPTKGVRAPGLETIYATYLFNMFHYYNYKCDLPGFVRALRQLLEIDLEKVDFDALRACELPQSLAGSDVNAVRRYLEYGLLFFALILPPNENCDVDLAQLQKQFYATLSHCPPLFQLYGKLTSGELILFKDEIIAQLKQHQFFTEAFFLHEPEQARRLFEKSLVQRSLLLISRYYSQASLTQLARLLQLAAHVLEDSLAEMVCSQVLDARINQLDDKIVFSHASEASELERWCAGVEKFIKTYSVCPEISLQDRLKA